MTLCYCHISRKQLIMLNKYVKLDE
uniref:Uncharacterized protein n=1 Tax=Rhizophora mucronata TaxID=61149 RepID=A0A2P2QKP7_RHIMU